MTLNLTIYAAGKSYSAWVVFGNGYPRPRRSVAPLPDDAKDLTGAGLTLLRTSEEG